MKDICLLIREEGCKGSVLNSNLKTIKAHEKDLKNRLTHVQRMLDMDESLEAKQRHLERKQDLNQALTALNKLKQKLDAATSS